jgi:hypothetical protein
LHTFCGPREPLAGMSDFAEYGSRFARGRAMGCI